MRRVLFHRATTVADTKTYIIIFYSIKFQSKKYDCTSESWNNCLTLIVAINIYVQWLRKNMGVLSIAKCSHKSIWSQIICHHFCFSILPFKAGPSKFLHCRVFYDTIDSCWKYFIGGLWFGIWLDLWCRENNVTPYAPQPQSQQIIDFFIPTTPSASAKPGTRLTRPDPWPQIESILPWVPVVQVASNWLYTLIVVINLSS